MRSYIVLAAMLTFSSGCAPTPMCEDDTMAFTMAQNFLRDSLRAPSTAQFASYSESSVTRSTQNDECSFIVRTYVDAQNGFGAQIRSTKRVEVIPTGGGGWKLVGIY
jgi:hypothetical protein